MCACTQVGEKTSDPLAMYAGDLATVSINLAGLPALVLPVGHTAPQVGCQLGCSVCVCTA